MTDSNIVHIIDDDAAVRDSLAFLLGTEAIRTRQHESALEFLAIFKPDEAGCIITDMRMPGMDGLELLRKLQERKNSVPVIVVTGHGDISLAVEAMKAGASDFLEKPFDQDVVLSAVRAALDRRQHQDGQSAEQTAIAQRFASLSPREKQVLEGLVAGLPNKTIAYDLGISARTVEVYRANLMTKMEANSLADLVRIVLTAKLVDKK
jgi:two-component system response regulator FixJ